MKRLVTACAALSVCLLAASASGHNYLLPTLAPAGFVHDIVMRVPHGCKGSPVNKVRIKIPEGVYRVSVEHREDWDVEVKMRQLDPPIVVEAGREITETVDQISWSNPKYVLPPDRIGEFRFRAMLPNEPGRVLFFKTLNDCEEGTDYYVDVPEEPLDLRDPKFHEDFWDLMSATATPAPYMILVKPERPQYPWEWKTDADKPLPEND